MTEDKAQNQSVWHIKTNASPIGPTTWRRPIGEKVELFPVVYNMYSSSFNMLSEVNAILKHHYIIQHASVTEVYIQLAGLPGFPRDNWSIIILITLLNSAKCL